MAVLLPPASGLDFYEPFADLNGTSPPSGWKQVNSQLEVADPGFVADGSLEFTDLPTPEGNSFGIEFPTTEAARASWQSKEIDGINQDEVFYSFLLRIDEFGRLSDDGGHTALIMLAEKNAGMTIGGRAVAGMAIRKSGESFRLGISSGHYGFLGGAEEADINLPLGKTVLVVIKFDHNAGVAELWVNPKPGGSEPSPSAVAEPTRVRLDKVNCVFIGGQTSVTVAPERFTIDEIRVGNSWAEVVPGN